MPKVRSRLKDHVEAKSREFGFEITQTQLAQALQVRQATVSAWMSDEPIDRIDVTVLAKMAKYFGVSLWDMLEVEEDPEKETRSTPNAA
ncbi:MAG: helix-turn-helix transcriptional regulator [Anaerolineae bacterium]|nr:MAG: helix-turn-helix transcriptional regulator [Anaerolineae bacterium]